MRALEDCNSLYYVLESHNKVGFAQFHSNLASSVPVYLNAFGLEKNPVDDKRIQCILTKMS